MTDQYYTRTILFLKNRSYQAQLEHIFNPNEIEKIDNCIDRHTRERDLHNCLIKKISVKRADEVMRILGFITLGG